VLFTFFSAACKIVRDEQAWKDEAFRRAGKRACRSCAALKRAAI
jgi:hypothetical protein